MCRPPDSLRGWVAYNIENPEFFIDPVSKFSEVSFKISNLILRSKILSYKHKVTGQHMQSEKRASSVREYTYFLKGNSLSRGQRGQERGLHVLQPSLLHRIMHKVNATAEVELSHQAGFVGFYRFDA